MNKSQIMLVTLTCFFIAQMGCEKDERPLLCDDLYYNFTFNGETRPVDPYIVYREYKNSKDKTDSTTYSVFTLFYDDEVPLTLYEDITFDLFPKKIGTYNLTELNFKDRPMGKYDHNSFANYDQRNIYSLTENKPNYLVIEFIDLKRRRIKGHFELNAYLNDTSYDFEKDMQILGDFCLNY